MISSKRVDQSSNEIVNDDENKTSSETNGLTVSDYTIQQLLSVNQSAFTDLISGLQVLIKPEMEALPSNVLQQSNIHLKIQFDSSTLQTIPNL